MNECHLLITVDDEPLKEILVFDSCVERPDTGYVNDGLVFDFAVTTNPETGELVRIGDHADCLGQAVTYVKRAAAMAGRVDSGYNGADVSADWLLAPSLN